MDMYAARLLPRERERGERESLCDAATSLVADRTNVSCVPVQLIRA
jgi:hypothetical protein